jgi:hypothetical protein
LIGRRQTEGVAFRLDQHVAEDGERRFVATARLTQARSLCQILRRRTSTKNLPSCADCPYTLVEYSTPFLSAIPPP